MHVNPIASDGNWTIGYDADGVAGQWPGNMTKTCETANWMTAKDGDELRAFFDDADLNIYYIATQLPNGPIAWTDGSDNWEDIRDVLKRYGDR